MSYKEVFPFTFGYLLSPPLSHFLSLTFSLSYTLSSSHLNSSSYLACKCIRVYTHTRFRIGIVFSLSLSLSHGPSRAFVGAISKKAGTGARRRFLAETKQTSASASASASEKTFISPFLLQGLFNKDPKTCKNCFYWSIFKWWRNSGVVKGTTLKSKLIEGSVKPHKYFRKLYMASITQYKT